MKPALMAFVVLFLVGCNTPEQRMTKNPDGGVVIRSAKNVPDSVLEVVMTGGVRRVVITRADGTKTVYPESRP